MKQFFLHYIINKVTPCLFLTPKTGPHCSHLSQNKSALDANFCQVMKQITLLSCWFWQDRNTDHKSGTNLQYHVSERLDIPQAPLWLLLELLSRLGHQLRAQGAGVDGWRRPWEPALSHSCRRVHWRRPEVDLMLISHGPSGWCCVRNIKRETSVCTVF